MQPELLKEIVHDDAFHRLYEEATQNHLGPLDSRGQFSQSPSSVQLESLLSEGIVRPSTVQRANDRTGKSHHIASLCHLYPAPVVGPSVRLPNADRQEKTGSKWN